MVHKHYYNDQYFFIVSYFGTSLKTHQLYIVLSVTLYLQQNLDKYLRERKLLKNICFDAPPMLFTLLKRFDKLNIR